MSPLDAALFYPLDGSGLSFGVRIHIVDLGLALGPLKLHDVQLGAFLHDESWTLSIGLHLDLRLGNQSLAVGLSGTWTLGRSVMLKGNLFAWTSPFGLDWLTVHNLLVSLKL